MSDQDVSKMLDEARAEFTGQPATNCPFYGRSMFAQVHLPLQFLLLDTKGNQCGLVTDALSPCWMEINHKPVEWRECPRMKDVRMEHD